MGQAQLQKALDPAFIITGAQGVGKTRLLKEMVAEEQGEYFTSPGGGETFETDTGLIALDEADKVSSDVLFTLINRAMARGRPLILSGSSRPATWLQARKGKASPDLINRLSASPTIILDAPDEETIALALAEALRSVGLNLPMATVQTCGRKICRRFSAVIDIASSALRLSSEVRAAKALLDAAIADNPQHSLS